MLRIKVFFSISAASVSRAKTSTGNRSGVIVIARPTNPTGSKNEKHIGKSEGRNVSTKYCRTSNIRRTSVINKIVDHSDIVGAWPTGVT